MSKIFYVTKYALAYGIDQCPLVRDLGDGWVSLDGLSSCVRIGRDAFETRAEADADVRQRAARKIASLKKQLAKLEKLAAPASSEKEGRDSFNRFGYDATSPEAGAGFRDEEPASNG